MSSIICVLVRIVQYVVVGNVECVKESILKCVVVSGVQHFSEKCAVCGSMMQAV